MTGEAIVTYSPFVCDENGMTWRWKWVNHPQYWSEYAVNIDGYPCTPVGSSRPIEHDPMGADWVRTIKAPRPVSVAAWLRCARRGKFWWPGKTFTIDLREEGT